jgi:hypothetical protein
MITGPDEAALVSPAGGGRVSSDELQGSFAPLVRDLLQQLACAVVAAGLGDVARDFLGVADDGQSACSAPSQFSFGHTVSSSLVRDLM